MVPCILPSMIDSCAEVAEWETALDLLAQLRAGQVEEGGKPLDADTVSFNATINALGRGGEWKKAVALLREMTKAGLGVKVRCSYGGATGGCCVTAVALSILRQGANVLFWNSTVVSAAVGKLRCATE